MAASPEPVWTPTRIEARLRKAMALSAVMSAERFTAVAAGKAHPETIGCIGSALPKLGDSAAAGAETDDGAFASATKTLAWLQWLEPADAELVVARLEGASWKSVCWRFGSSRPTADRRWRYALALIAWRLNGHVRERAPSMRSLLPEFEKRKV